MFRLPKSGEVVKVICGDHAGMIGCVRYVLHERYASVFFTPKISDALVSLTDLRFLNAAGEALTVG